MKSKNTTRGIFSALGSLQLGITLIAVIAAASIIGTLIPQGLDDAEYIKKYGQQTYSLFKSLRFTSLYESGWFIALLSGLGLNLLLCSFCKVSFKKISVWLIHSSLIVILAGSVVTARFVQKGFIGLREGAHVHEFFDSRRQTAKDLGFTLELIDFAVTYYPVRRHRLFVLERNTDTVRECLLGIGESCTVDDTGYSLTLKKYFPNFYIEAGSPRNRDDQRENPAVLVSIHGGGQKIERWVFAHFPHLMRDAFQNVRIAYEASAPVKEFKSSITIRDEGTSIPAQIRVNHPFRYKGYTFYQTTYNPDDLTWSGISVRKDPGVGIIFVGFCLLNAGVIFHFYTKAKRGASS